MRRSSKNTLRIIAHMMLTLTLLSTNAHSTTSQQIFAWVARQMEIEDVNDMPAIKYVSKAQLQHVLQELSVKSYSQMKSNLGGVQAEEIMGTYLANVVGLFHPETQIIYIGAFLSPCRKKAVLAHEFTHYFQEVIEGRIHPHDYAADYKRSRREMKAYDIERRFEKAFCNRE